MPLEQIYVLMLLAKDITSEEQKSFFFFYNSSAYLIWFAPVGVGTREDWHSRRFVASVKSTTDSELKPGSIK